MPDFDRFSYGGVDFPLSTSSTNTALQDCDPALYWMIQYFSGCITQHIGARLVKDAAACQAPITKAVAMTTHLDPIPLIFGPDFTFPLLSIWRQNGEFDYKTVNWSMYKGRFGFAYCLPVLNKTQAIALTPFLKAIPAVLYNRIEQGFDPNVLGGAKVWDATHAGLMEIDLVKDSFGLFKSPANQGPMPYYAVTGALEVIERQMPEKGLTPFQGGDVNIALTNNSDTNPIEDFVDVKTDVIPPAAG